MIKYIKAKKHKAIKVTTIENLGKINVLCGKNNSGKTSIFEALSTNGYYAIGEKVTKENESQFISAILTHMEDRNYKDIYRNEVCSKIEELAIHEKLVMVWHNHDIIGTTTNIETLFNESIEKIYYKDFTPTTINEVFNLDNISNIFLSKLLTSYKPLLIPPKRILETKIPLDFTKKMGKNGAGILNRLFFLKNQDLHSDDYKKYQKIYNYFFDITKLYFNITLDNRNRLTLVYGSDEEWFAGDDWGLGLSDILIILTLVVDTDASFIFIEEPENHLHADYQKRLLYTLKSIEERQFFLSTHSPVFLDIDAVDSIFYVCNNNGEVTVNNETKKSQMIADLGYSVAENLTSDAIILIEGPNDRPAIEQILDLVDSDLRTQFNLKFWPLGGNNMARLDLTVFSERYNVFALIDNDKGSKKTRIDFLENCKKVEIFCVRLERYSIENYVTLPAIKKVYPDKTYNDNIKEIEPELKVKEQLDFYIKEKLSDIFKEMSIKDIEGTDLLDFVNEIKTRLKSDDTNEKVKIT